MNGRIFRNAAEILYRDGWCQNALRDERGRRCVVEALCAADPNGAVSGAQQTLRNHLGVPSLAHWNNEPGRTQAEVIHRLYECADAVDEMMYT